MKSNSAHKTSEKMQILIEEDKIKKLNQTEKKRTPSLLAVKSWVQSESQVFYTSRCKNITKEDIQTFLVFGFQKQFSVFEYF